MMPLSAPQEDREPVYCRRIEYRGFRREGILWDIEGRLRDVRTADFPCVDRGGFIRAGEPFHEMLLRLTVDDDLIIHGIEAVVEYAPFKVCPCTQALFGTLVGMKIEAGFFGEVKKRLPPLKTCRHLIDLLMGTAAAAFQTVAQVRYFQYMRGVKPEMIDSCMAWDSAGEVVRREWPRYYAGKDGDAHGQT